MLRFIDALVMLSSNKNNSLNERRKFYDEVFGATDNILTEILTSESGWLCALISDSLKAIKADHNEKYFNNIFERIFKKLQIFPNKKALIQLENDLKIFATESAEVMRIGSTNASISVMQIWTFIVELLQSKCSDHQLVNDLCSVYVLGFKSPSDEVLAISYKSWQSMISAFFVIDPRCASRAFPDRLKLLMKPFCSSKAKNCENIAGYIFDSWCHLIKCIGEKLPLFFEQAIIPFMLFCVGGRIRTVPVGITFEKLKRNCSEDETRILLIFSDRDNLKIPSFRPILSFQLQKKVYKLFENLLTENGELSFVITQQSTANELWLKYGIFMVHCVRLLALNASTLMESQEVLQKVSELWCFLANKFQLYLSNKETHIKLFEAQLIQFCRENEVDIFENIIALICQRANCFNQQSINTAVSKIKSKKKMMSFIADYGSNTHASPMASTPLRSEPLKISDFFKKTIVKNSPISTNANVLDYFKERGEPSRQIELCPPPKLDYFPDAVNKNSIVSIIPYEADLQTKHTISLVGIEESEDSEVMNQKDDVKDVAKPSELEVVSFNNLVSGTTKPSQIMNVPGNIEKAVITSDNVRKKNTTAAAELGIENGKYESERNNTPKPAPEEHQITQPSVSSNERSMAITKTINKRGRPRLMQKRLEKLAITKTIKKRGRPSLMQKRMEKLAEIELMKKKDSESNSFGNKIADNLLNTINEEMKDEPQKHTDTNSDENLNDDGVNEYSMYKSEKSKSEKLKSVQENESGNSKSRDEPSQSTTHSTRITLARAAKALGHHPNKTKPRGKLPRKRLLTKDATSHSGNGNDKGDMPKGNVECSEIASTKISHPKKVTRRMSKMIVSSGLAETVVHLNGDGVSSVLEKLNNIELFVKEVDMDSINEATLTNATEPSIATVEVNNCVVSHDDAKNHPTEMPKEDVDCSKREPVNAEISLRSNVLKEISLNLVNASNNSILSEKVRCVVEDNISSTPTLVQHSGDENQNPIEDDKEITKSESKISVEVNVDISLCNKEYLEQVSIYKVSCESAFASKHVSELKPVEVLPLNNNAEPEGAFVSEDQHAPIEVVQTTVGTPLNKSNVSAAVVNTPPSILKRNYSPSVSSSSRHNRRVHFEANNLNDNEFDGQEKCTTPKIKRARKFSVWADIIGRTSPNIVSPGKRQPQQSPTHIGNRYSSSSNCDLIPLEKLEKSLPFSKISSVKLSSSPQSRKRADECVMPFSKRSNISFEVETSPQVDNFNEIAMNSQSTNKGVAFVTECVDCTEAISMKICQILAPSASTTLYQQLKAKNILSIGDFASLSESEVSFLHIKPPDRVERARDVLRKYYAKTSTATASISSSASNLFQQEIPSQINESQEIVENSIPTNTMTCSENILVSLTGGLYNVTEENHVNMSNMCADVDAEVNEDLKSVHQNENLSNDQCHTATEIESIVENNEPLISSDSIPAVLFVKANTSQQINNNDNASTETVVCKLHDLLNELSEKDLEICSPVQLAELSQVLSSRLSLVIEAWKTSA